MGHCICSGTVTEEQGLFSATGNNHIFNLPIMKTLLQAQCHALHIFKFTSMFNYYNCKNKFKTNYSCIEFYISQLSICK